MPAGAPRDDGLAFGKILTKKAPCGTRVSKNSTAQKGHSAALTGALSPTVSYMTLLEIQQLRKSPPHPGGTARLVIHLDRLKLGAGGDIARPQEKARSFGEPSGDLFALVRAAVAPPEPTDGCAPRRWRRNPASESPSSSDGVWCWPTGSTNGRRPAVPRSRIGSC